MQDISRLSAPSPETDALAFLPHAACHMRHASFCAGMLLICTGSLSSGSTSGGRDGCMTNARLHVQHSLAGAAQTSPGTSMGAGKQPSNAPTGVPTGAGKIPSPFTSRSAAAPGSTMPAVKSRLGPGRSNSTAAKVQSDG